MTIRNTLSSERLISATALWLGIPALKQYCKDSTLIVASLPFLGFLESNNFPFREKVVNPRSNEQKIFSRQKLVSRQIEMEKNERPLLKI